MSSSDNVLDPNSSPTRQKPVTGVKKVNNWPLILMFVGIAIFLLIMMLVGMDRAAQQEERMNAKPVQEAKLVGDTSAQANAIIQGRETGYIEAEEVIKPVDVEKLEQAATPVESASIDPEVQKIIEEAPPPRNLPNKRPTGDESRMLELQRQIEQEKFRAYRSAVSSNTALSSGSGNSGFSLNTQSSSMPLSRNSQLSQLNQLEQVNQQLEAMKNGINANPTALYQKTLAQIQNSGLVQQAQSGSSLSAQPMSLMNGNRPSSSGDSLSQFDGAKTRWDLDEDREPPKGSYQLHAGFVIPAMMITGINSDVAGQIIGQVSQNVYDSVTGEHLLIPQGSRIVGTYSSNVAFGQEAVFVAWQRFIFPDGKTMDIGSMAGADSAGLAGFRDKVNHHYWRVFGSAFLMSLITAGVELSQDDGSGEISRERSALNEALGQQLGQAAAQLIMRNLNIAPTIEIRAGYRFNIMVSKDMVFNRPYVSYDY